MSDERPVAAACSRDHVREAAVWMAMLRGPDRTAKLERGFRRWISADRCHYAAFETVSAAWEATGALPKGVFPRLSRWQRAGFRQGFAQAAMAVAATIAVLGVYLHQRNAGIATGVGEQRMLLLDDGTRIFMNTDTHVVVKFDDARRAVELKGGEALFEVARKGPQWPFMVRVEDRQITALGTSFVVRRDPQRTSVMLVEGSVIVAPVSRNAMPAGSYGAPAEGSDAIKLAPGQRLTFDDRGHSKLDAPALEKVTAWRGGHVVLDEVSLAAAAAEMNRYSRVRLVIEEARTATIPVTGVFRAGDTASFANAIAQSYGLDLVEEANVITLLGVPRRSAPDSN